MIIKNLTPHKVVVFAEDRETVKMVIEPEGIVPRVSFTNSCVGQINGIDVKATKYGEVENMPEPKENTVFIVSQMVLARLNREDCVAPDTGSGAVRDTEGKIIGTTNFLKL